MKNCKTMKMGKMKKDMMYKASKMSKKESPKMAAKKSMKPKKKMKY